MKVKTSGPSKGREISVEVINTSDVFFKDNSTRYKVSYVNKNMILVMKQILKNAVEGTIEELEKGIKRLQNRSTKPKKEIEKNRRWQSEFKQLIKKRTS